MRCIFQYHSKSQSNFGVERSVLLTTMKRNMRSWIGSSGNTLALAFSSTAGTGSIGRLGDDIVRRKFLLFISLSFVVLANKWFVILGLSSGFG